MSDLVWMGSLEECDCCHEIYPMSWIVYNGIQFLCYSCNYPLENKFENSIDEIQTTVKM